MPNYGFGFTYNGLLNAWQQNVIRVTSLVGLDIDTLLIKIEFISRCGLNATEFTNVNICLNLERG